MNPNIPLCRCGKHYHFQPCAKAKRSKAATKLIWSPSLGRAPKKDIPPAEDKDLTLYLRQKTTGDYYYCCTCKWDFYAEEPNPHACAICGSRHWDNPNQWSRRRPEVYDR